MKSDRSPREEALPVELMRRVWIEDLQPSVDGGRHPVKRTSGETVIVEADILTDGHDRLAAVVRHAAGSSEDWQESPMRPLHNDRWRGEFTVDAPGVYRFTVSAWVDRLASWREEVTKKRNAGQSLSSELQEGAELVQEAAGRAKGPARTWLKARAAEMSGDGPEEERADAALSPELMSIAQRYADRSQATTFEPIYDVMVTCERARFGAWYEMFPRSASTEPGRSGTFGEAERLLPEIAGMGFDVLYIPPIHPIGRTHRKGPNNTIAEDPDSSPGSPWAIGSKEGGHTAVHPDLGTLEDFRHFLEAVRKNGLELALDLAFQCSPDHPYVSEHPEWFRHRPDGTIKYAENPPKKYEDIYPLDFECESWRELWMELRRVVEFWIETGVTIFRVDNPHTKPIRFWQWLISGIKADRPDVIFLSEAFTRPKLMYALAKAGFDQSYTYFTWRNTKKDLIDYLTSLTTPPVRDFFRPNFFTNTPDILPEYLQYGGRSAFQVRLVLAATLGASYGIYSGFELCESEAVPGTEEYANSEKYEIRPRESSRPDDLRPLIRRINAVRRENPALWTGQGLRFHPVDSNQILFFSKKTRDLSNIILVAANLDPHHVHDGWVEVPLHELGIAEDEAYQVHDLIGEGRYLWQGARNYVRLDPAQLPAQIFRIRRRIRTEQDFDYFM